MKHLQDMQSETLPLFPAVFTSSQLFSLFNFHQIIILLYFLRLILLFSRDPCTLYVKSKSPINFFYKNFLSNCLLSHSCFYHHHHPLLLLSQMKWCSTLLAFRMAVPELLLISLLWLFRGFPLYPLSKFNFLLLTLRYFFSVWDQFNSFVFLWLHISFLV